MAQAVKTPTAELLVGIYKNVKMASDTLLDLMPRVKDEKLKNDMTVQISVYEGFASRAAKLMAETGARPEEEGMMSKMTSKMTSKMSVMMGSMRDGATDHIAEMIIKGAVSGTNEMMKLIRDAEAHSVTGEPMHLAHHLCDYEQKTAEDMKSYLRGRGE